MFITKFASLPLENTGEAYVCMQVDVNNICHLYKGLLAHFINISGYANVHILPSHYVFDACKDLEFKNSGKTHCADASVNYYRAVVLFENNFCLIPCVH